MVEPGMIMVRASAWAEVWGSRNTEVRMGTAMMAPPTPKNPPSVPLATPSRAARPRVKARSEEHTSELQSLMRISYAVFCLKNKQKEPNRLQHDRPQTPTDQNK